MKHSCALTIGSNTNLELHLWMLQATQPYSRSTWSYACMKAKPYWTLSSASHLNWYTNKASPGSSDRYSLFWLTVRGFSNCLWVHLRCHPSCPLVTVLDSFKHKLSGDLWWPWYKGQTPKTCWLANKDFSTFLQVFTWLDICLSACTEHRGDIISQCFA